MNCFVGLLSLFRNVMYDENSIVNFVSRDGVYFNRVNSPTGLNAQLYCSCFDLPLSRLISVNRNFVQHSFSPVSCTLFSS